jgi:predicted metal-dependent phosphoesterase TrpH
MRIDLHIHTWPRSQCSHIKPKDLVQEALRVGLDGFCLTEHQVLWDPAEVEALAGDTGLTILRGNEITTAQGDVLAFGLEKDIKGVITIRELKEEAEEEGAFLILAHPFRGFKLFGIGERDMKIDQAARKKAFQFVDAIEIRNGNIRDQENQMAEKVAERLNLPGTAGSDAHHLDNVGVWVMDFERRIEDEAALIRELKARRFTLASARPD